MSRPNKDSKGGRCQCVIGGLPGGCGCGGMQTDAPECVPESHSFGHQRAFNSALMSTHRDSEGQAINYDFGAGYNWAVSAWPYMTDMVNERIYAVLPGQNLQFTWDPYTNGFRSDQGYGLVYSNTANLFTLSAPDGGVWEFVGFKQGTLAKGRFKSFLGADGSSTQVTGYTGFGHIAGLQTTSLAGGNAYSETYQYEYTVHADKVERLATFMKSRQGGGSSQGLQRFTYAYSAGGDLATATSWKNVNGEWIESGTHHYRYYNDGDTGGSAHTIKHVLSPEQHEALAADPEVTDPLTASDEKVAQYALRTYQYNSSYNVASVAHLDGSQSTFQQEEGDTSNTDPNHYKVKLIAFKPGGFVETIYRNHLNQVLLREFKESVTAQDKVLDYYEYDAQGNLLLHATPAALEGYTVDYGYAITPQYRSEGGQYHVGLIHVYTYYPETTTHQGGVGVKGYKEYEKTKQGRDGAPITLAKYEYTQHSATITWTSGFGDWATQRSTPMTVYPVASETRYPNEDGSSPIVTSYTYTWHPDSIQMESRTTTLPAVPVEQNGSGVSATRTEKFDTFGRLVWLRDERGFLAHHQYDAFGNLVQTIQDVDDALAAVPDGWSTPAEGGQHLVTDYEYDSLGRVTQVLGPEHEAVIDDQTLTVRTATWTVYKDATRETWTAQGYAIATGFTSSNEPCFDSWLVNPVSITKSDIAGRTRESIQAVRTSREGKLSASDSFIQSSYVRWTTNQYDLLGRLISTRAYHTIPATGDGERGTHYDQTDYGYDSMGRQNRQTSPGGTITHTVFNPQGQPIAVYVGTDDTGATDADPTGGATGTNNMVLVTEYEYNTASGCPGCGGGGGYGQLAALIQHVDAQDFRLTNDHYDWRNRQEYLVFDEDAEGRVTYTKNYYDNLDRVVKTERYWQRGGAFSSSSGGDDLLLARQETFYDDRGQVYRTRTYAVDELGQLGNHLEANTWFDAAGNPIKQQAAGTKAFTKTVYDSLGRAVKQYIGHDTDETTYTEAASVSDDTILEQTETVYNEAGSALFVTARRRMHNATGTGELNDPSGSQPKARTSYQASWYDGLGRPIASANYGTAGGVAPTRPATPPERSDEVLVTSTVYNDCGEAFSTTDPAGRDDRQEFDALGRVVRTIQNYQDGVVDGEHPDEDVTVEMAYGADGQLLTLTAKNPATGDQVTRYVYGTTLADSAIARSDLLRAEIYPDSDDTVEPLGNGMDGVYDRVEYTYNRQGKRTAKKDQNETVHAYDYDHLGRRIEDRVTAVGSGVDDWVRRIATRYTVRGQVEKITSYDDPAVGSGTVLNEVRFVYNAFDQLIEDYQSHSGAVDMVTTPKVGYAYTDGSSGHVRPTQLVYPNGRILRYEYSSGTDDALNRISFLADDDSGAVGTHLAEYAYLGNNQFVQVTYPEPNLRYDLAHGTGDDPYDGLDRFDRVVDLVWRDQSRGVDVERIKHGYDRAGNRLWRETPVATANGVHLDELYTYDGMNQLVAFARGDLNTAKTGLMAGTKTLAQEWSLDATGNWSSFQEDTDGNGTWDLAQSRAHNPANEITQLAGTSVHMAHDRAGNMARLPKPADGNNHHDLVYDLWNRLVKVLDGEATVIEYAYDGRNFRSTETSAGTTRHYFYANGWQVLEERIDTATAADRQFVWGLRYIDDLVLRDRNASCGGTLDERFYALQDANWNVVAISHATGAMQERYIYTAYGMPQFLTGAFGSRTLSPYGWKTLYCGYHWDQLIESYHIRHRLLSPHLGRWNRQDPVAADPNLYRYVRNNPTVYVDPSGLREAASPFDYVAGAMILRINGPRDGEAETGDMLSSQITLFGQSVVAQFLGKNGCCLCTKVGFVQIAKNRLDITMGWFGPTVLWLDFWGNRDWFLDGGVPYGGHSIDPCKRPLQRLPTGDQVAMIDLPGIHTGSYWFGSNVHYFSQSFETHLVCLGGLEKGATYGGVQWGHSFTIKPGFYVGSSIDKYDVNRWAARVGTASAEFKKLVGAAMGVTPE